MHIYRFYPLIMYSIKYYISLISWILIYIFQYEYLII